MTATAMSVGTLFPRRSWEGRILSLHDGAANLLRENGLLLSLVTSRDSMTSLSVEVRLPTGGGPLGSILECGARAAGSTNLLTLGDLAIDLASAPLWSGSLSARSLGGRARQPPRLNLRRAVTLLNLAIGETAPDDGLAGLVRDPQGSNRFARRCAEVLASLEVRPPATGGRPRAARPSAVLRHRGTWGTPYSGAIRGLSGVVGLGIGLTPSGDDFLAGALLGERIVLVAGGGRPPLFIDRDEIAGALSDTSAAGATLLRLALHDSFPAYLLDLARSVVAARELPAVLAAVRHATSHGATSGSDACTGLWWYLSLHSYGAPSASRAKRKARERRPDSARAIRLSRLAPETPTCTA